MSKIAAGLFQAFSSIGYVEKDKRNEFHKYAYASEEAILKEVREKLLEAGIMFIPSVQNVSPIDPHGNTTLTVEYTIMHKDGEMWPEKIIAVGSGNDKSQKTGVVGDKGVYKALTGANKYMLLKLFQITTGSDPEAPEAEDPRDRGVPMGRDFDAPFERPSPPPQNAYQQQKPSVRAGRQVAPVTPRSNGTFISNTKPVVDNARRRTPTQGEIDTANMLIANIAELDTLRAIDQWSDDVRKTVDALPLSCYNDVAKAKKRRQAEINPAALAGAVGGQTSGNTGNFHED